MSRARASRAFFPELEPMLHRVHIGNEGGERTQSDSARIYTAACVYLYDSAHCRSIQHSTDAHALTAYVFVHVSKWKKFVRLVVWIHLLLGFVEPPSSLTFNGQRIGPSHLGCAGVEFACLLVYTFHAFKQYQAYGPGPLGYWRSNWRSIKVLVLAICFIDVLVSAIRNVDGPGVHLSQVLRVFFLLELSGRMRQLCTCILKSLPTILSVMFLLFLHISIFALIGYACIRPLETLSEIYPEDSTLYFPTLAHSFRSTMIMLTTANFPSVMLPSYRNHWFVCIYFIVFMIVGLYCLLQLTVAVVFHSFQSLTKEALARALHHRERALQAAFTLLSEYTCGNGVLEFDTWKQLVANLRPEWTETQAGILFEVATMRDGDEHVQQHRDDAQEHRNRTMDFLQFEAIVRFTQVRRGGQGQVRGGMCGDPGARGWRDQTRVLRCNIFMIVALIITT